MYNAIRVATLMLIILFVGAIGASAGTTFDEALASYFNISDSVMARLAAVDIDSENLTVALFLAKIAGVEAEKMAAYRAQGDSWMDVMKSRNIEPTDLYFMISGDIQGKLFGPIFTKYDSTAQDKWDEIFFEDEEIIDLVNLRFVYQHNDYSAFKVMNLRESGNSWVTIYDTVRQARDKMIKEEKAKAKAAREKEAEGEE